MFLRAQYPLNVETGICVCLCVDFYMLCVSTVRHVSACLSSYSQLLSLAQYLKTAYAQCFHFGQSRQTCCSLQHDTKPLVGSLTAYIFCSGENALRFNRNKKSADQKLTVCVCVRVCVYVCSRACILVSDRL